jgi:type IV pilus assembly protein PilC
MAATATQKSAPSKQKNTAQFLWEAKTKSGETKKGEMEASDIEAVNARLKSLGLNPVKVRRKGLLDSDLNINIGSAVTGKDILVFTRPWQPDGQPGLPQGRVRHQEQGGAGLHLRGRAGRPPQGVRRTLRPAVRRR